VDHYPEELITMETWRTVFSEKLVPGLDFLNASMVIALGT
jgi:hypothetical protein